MGEVEKATEKLIEKAAIVAREALDKRTKVHDRAAVKLELRVRCLIALQEYAPPLRVVVNGVALPDLLNKPDLLNNNDGHERNELTTWCEVPIKVGGPNPITIILEPTGLAAAFFHRGKSRKRRFNPAYTRNEVEAHGDKYSVPPKTDEYPPHILEITIAAKRRGLLHRLPKDLPEEWKVSCQGASSKE